MLYTTDPCKSHQQKMDTAIGLAIIGALVLILLWQKPASDDSPEQPQPIVIERVVEKPIYDYPVTYTSSPWRIPAYSYGSAYEYRRFHSPIVHPRRHGPSVIPRVAMSHPVSYGGRRPLGRH